jgi:hypothetical protein
MNILSRDKQIAVISALTEGCSIRSVERLTDIHRDTIFIGIDATRKAIISYRVGKRDRDNTVAFLADLRQRIVNRPEISSDGFSAYPDAVERAFGLDCSFAQIIKQYHGEPAIDTARRYSPGVVVGVERRLSGSSKIGGRGTPCRISVGCPNFAGTVSELG